MRRKGWSNSRGERIAFENYTSHKLLVYGTSVLMGNDMGNTLVVHECTVYIRIQMYIASFGLQLIWRVGTAIYTNFNNAYSNT
jgi:hypothetical protein